MNQNLTNSLLKWYALHGRNLPWRTKGGAHPDAYAVWISEIMLQQTTVATVFTYFDKWMKRFPTVQDLAKADLQDVSPLQKGFFVLQSIDNFRLQYSKDFRVLLSKSRL